MIEIAVGLVIIGLVIGSFITPVSTLRDNARRAEVATMLDDIHDAIIGFAVNNSGRLPCPATAASSGAEAIVGLNCSSEHGFVPAVTLGLQGRFGDNNAINDPWGNPYRYSLSSTAAFQICTQNNCPGATTILASGISAVILSTGVDGALATSSPDQLENTDGDDRFVQQTFREGANNEFDDHIRWLSPNILTLYLTR